MPEIVNPAKERYERIAAFVDELDIDGLEELGMVLLDRQSNGEDEEMKVRAELEVLSRIVPPLTEDH